MLAARLARNHPFNVNFAVCKAVPMVNVYCSNIIIALCNLLSLLISFLNSLLCNHADVVLLKYALLRPVHSLCLALAMAPATVSPARRLRQSRE